MPAAAKHSDMQPSHPFALPKRERICGKKQLERIFNGGQSRSMSAFPLRLVYMIEDRSGDGMATTPVQMMVSVPKRHLRHAVERNRVKRLVREAYRTNRQLLLEALPGDGSKTLSLCFIWNEDHTRDYAEVQSRVRSLLTRLGERMLYGKGTQRGR